MIFVTLKRYVARFAVVGLAVVAAGCSGATPEEEGVESVHQPFGSSSCGTAAANHSVSGAVDPKHISPSSYNTCYRGYVVDINNLSSSYTGLGGGGGWNSHISVTWEGAIPTTQAACESAWGAAVFYKLVGGAWVDQTGQIDVYGIWHPPGGLTAWCEVPEISTLGGVTLAAGASYRVAATMRSSYGSATLRPIGVKNIKRLILQ